MEPSVEIGSAGVSVTFAAGTRLDNGALEMLDVSIRDVDLEAAKSVYKRYDDGFEQLARFFEDLAASWRGWSGERVYESIEHDLRIIATHDKHVRLGVRLWQATNVDGWRLETAVRLDAGEQLSQAARDMSALVRG